MLSPLFRSTTVQERRNPDIHQLIQKDAPHLYKLSLYYEKKEPDIPLEDNKEFRSLKNDIIRAAVQMDNYLVSSGYSTEQKVGFLFTNVFRAFLKLFQNNYDRHAKRLGRQVDRKLRSKIAQKKAALGIRPEQSDYENNYEQSM